MVSKGGICTWKHWKKFRTLISSRSLHTSYYFIYCLLIVKYSFMKPTEFESWNKTTNNKSASQNTLIKSVCNDMRTIKD